MVAGVEVNVEREEKIFFLFFFFFFGFAVVRLLHPLAQDNLVHSPIMSTVIALSADLQSTLVHLNQVQSIIGESEFPGGQISPNPASLFLRTPSPALSPRYYVLEPLLFSLPP